RYYDGKWSWEGIFEAIDIPLIDVNTADRNSIVEFGLLRWNRSVRVVHYRRQFLGTVATEGGLPLNRLKEAGGWLNTVLGTVLRKHIARGLDVSTLLEGYKEKIPQSFQSVEILQILEDLILCVVQVRKAHKLDSHKDPVFWLDKNDIGWRDRFPLPLESEVANALLLGLIKQAAETKEFSEAEVHSIFSVERYIKNESTDPKIKARLDAPSFFPEELFQKNQICLERARYDFDLVFDSGRSHSWGRAFKTVSGDKVGYRFTGRTLYLSDDLVLDALKLQVKADGEWLGSIPIMNGFRLDLNEPWLFTKSAEHYELQGMASQKTKKESALVYIPKNLRILMGQEADLFTLKNLYKGCLYQLSGRIECLDDELDLRYGMQTRSADSYLQYELEGSEFDRASKPGNVYIGIPNVVERNAITGSANRSSRFRLSVKRTGTSESWGELTNDSFGVYEARVIDEDGMTLSKRRIGILPAKFDWDIEVNRANPKAGTVILTGLPSVDITSTNDGVSISQAYDKEICRHTVSLTASGEQPLSVKFDLLRAGDSREITLDLPFPSGGARLFDATGVMLARGASLRLSRLHGYRLKVFCEHGVKAVYANLRIELISQVLDSSKQRDLYVNKKLKLTAPITEFALIDFLEDFTSLLGASSDLDASVKISMDVNGRPELSHLIHRYDCELKRDPSRQRISIPGDIASKLSLEEQVALSVDAILLNQPESNVLAPQQVTSEGVFLGEWEFDSLNRKAGLWFLFPEPESQIFFRPMLWPVGGKESQQLTLDDSASVKTLQRAVWVNDPRSRLEAIREVLHGMTLDFGHSGWDYLKALTDKCGHLPLSAFDVWSVAATEPPFLAAMATHAELEGIVDKMVDELPVLWELVSYADWENAITVYQAYHHRLYSGDAVSLDPSIVSVVRELLKASVLEKIESLSPSLKSTRQRLESQFLRVEDKELNLFSYPYEMVVKGQVEDLKRNLVTRNSESEWPIMLQRTLEHQLDNLPGALTNDLRVFRGYQKSVMFLPAVLAARQVGLKDELWIGDTVTVFKLQRIKEFDRDWFELMFNLISAWLHFNNKES
ncbi:hypothetical protein A3744_18305, partial [Oleiphilus sp. HI0073]